MTEPDEKIDTTAIEVDIADQAADSLQAGRPLFLIVYYENEAVKIAFLSKLRQALNTLGITPQSFDPGQRPEHAAGRLYPLLATVAETKSLALITGLPRLPEGGDLDLAFLEYLNLHRDLISRQHLRFVLFLHTADAGNFISSAGDLWDFRHHTYWLEGRPEAEGMVLWALPERALTRVHLTEKEQSTVKGHLEQVHALTEQTVDPEEKASLFLDLSRWLFRRNLYSLAVEAAFAGIASLPDTSVQQGGELERILGDALQNDHQLAEALHHYQHALAISREIGDRAGEGTTLNNISQIYRAWGHNEEALKTLEESLAISREIGNRVGEGATLNNISQIYKAWGRNEEALKMLKASLFIRREIGDRAGEGATLNNISMIYDLWGRYDEALKMLEASLAIRREIGDRAGEGATLNNISQIYSSWGRYEEALKTLEESLAISREIGDRTGEGTTLNNISQIYKAWGRYDEALKTLDESLAICREIGDRAGEGATLNNISQIYKALGRNEEALKTLEESLAISREIGDRAGEGTTLNNIATIYRAWGRNEEALKTLEESLAIRREIGDRAGEGVTCWNLAMEYHRRGYLPKAVEFARYTVAIDRETNNPDLKQDRTFLKKLERSLAKRKKR